MGEAQKNAFSEAASIFGWGGGGSPPVGWGYANPPPLPGPRAERKPFDRKRKTCPAHRRENPFIL